MHIRRWDRLRRCQQYASNARSEPHEHGGGILIIRVVYTIQQQSLGVQAFASRPVLHTRNIPSTLYFILSRRHCSPSTFQPTSPLPLELQSRGTTQPNLSRHLIPCDDTLCVYDDFLLISLKAWHGIAWQRGTLEHWQQLRSNDASTAVDTPCIIAISTCSDLLAKVTIIDACSWMQQALISNPRSQTEKMIVMALRAHIYVPPS